MQNSDDTLPPSSTSLMAAFHALVDTFRENQVNYAIIGGLAVIHYGRARTTSDIDALFQVPRTSLPALLEEMQRRGFHLDVHECVRELGETGFTVAEYDGVQIDLLQPVIPAYARALSRAVTVEMGRRPVRICSLEGLIITKLMAMREQDQVDIRELILAHASSLDVDFIRGELATFAPPGDPRYAKWESWLLEAGATGAA